MDPTVGAGDHNGFIHTSIDKIMQSKSSWGGISELVTLYLIVGVNASVHGCLSLYVGPVMSLRLVLGAPRQLGEAPELYYVL